jgi:hypothetical protein
MGVGGTGRVGRGIPVAVEEVEDEPDDDREVREGVEVGGGGGRAGRGGGVAAGESSTARPGRLGSGGGAGGNELIVARREGAPDSRASLSPSRAAVLPSSFGFDYGGGSDLPSNSFC